MNTNRSRFGLGFWCALLVTSFLLISCQHTKHGFGEPGPGKIAVKIEGDVKYKGLYYLDEGANLESVLSVFGGWAGHGDMSVPPTKAVLSRNGEREKTTYRFWKMTKEEREAVLLKDGDSLRFPTVIF